MIVVEMVKHKNLVYFFIELLRGGNKNNVRLVHIIFILLQLFLIIFLYHLMFAFLTQI